MSTRLALILAAIVVAPAAHAERQEPELDYPWVAALGAPTRSAEGAFPAPDGWSRIGAEAGSLTMWLRHLPVRTDRTTVLAYDGRVIRAPAAGVIALDVGTRDLQQCADTAIRLLSEHAWASGRAELLSWTFTSGDRTRWADWLSGESFLVAGSKVERRRGERRPATRATFGAWLDLVYTYAGTRSLARDGAAVTGVIEPGDVFVSPGSPGHAVLVMDVVTHPDGRRAALLVQGFMPAQEAHVLDGAGVSTPVIDGRWFVLPTEPDGALDTPSWAPFSRADARRFRW